MTFRDTHIHSTVLALTALFVVLSVLRFDKMVTVQYVLLAVGTAVIGIPHGATDNYLYVQLVSGRKTVHFYVVYLLVAIAYGVFWIYLPGFSLILFLLISVYHFGQSNLFYTDLPEHALVKKLIYVPWGAFNLAAPLLFRYEEAAPIIRFLIGYNPIGIEAAHFWAPVATTILLVVNITILWGLYRSRRLSRNSLLKEVVAFALLFSVYATAPLFVSFIVYWVFWHSLNSAIEISRTWRELSPLAQVWQFYKAAMPLTLVTFAGMALIFWAVDVYGSLEGLVGTFFVIIAAVTLPHTVVMERLYRERSRTSA